MITNPAADVIVFWFKAQNGDGEVHFEQIRKVRGDYSRMMCAYWYFLLCGWGSGTYWAIRLIVLRLVFVIPCHDVRDLRPQVIDISRTKNIISLEPARRIFNICNYTINRR